MSFIRTSGVVAVMAALAMTPTTIANSQDRRAQGYGHVEASSVTLARVDPVDDMLRGCGLNLGGILGVVSNRGRTTAGRRCDPRQKERQPFAVWRINPGEDPEIVMRTTNPVSQQTSFGGRQSLSLGLPSGDSSSCFVVGTLRGDDLRPVPVRRDRRDRYLFSNPIAAGAAARERAGAQALERRNELEQAGQQATRAQNALSRNRAYRASSRQCVMPQQRATPPRPNTMSSSTARYHARGQCVQRVAFLQESLSQVEDALLVSDQNDIIAEHRRWRNAGGNAPSCARTASHNEVTELGQGSGSYFTDWSVTLRRQRLRDAVNRCVRAVTNACTAAQRNWQSRVNTIRAEPRQSYNSCRTNLATLNRLEGNMDAYQNNYIAAQRAYQSMPETISRMNLGEARCQGASSSRRRR